MMDPITPAGEVVTQGHVGYEQSVTMLESSRWQATLGKRAVGIVVADIEGGNAAFVKTTVRFFLRIVSALPLGLAASSTCS